RRASWLDTPTECRREAVGVMESLNGFFFTFFNADVARQYLPSILAGAWVTVLTGVAVVLTGTACGIVLAILRALHCRPLSLCIVAFADILRSLPPLVLLIVLY